MSDRARTGWAWMVLAFTLAAGGGLMLAAAAPTADRLTGAVFVFALAVWAMLRGFAAFSIANDGP